MRKINTRSIINFDNSATTYPKPPAVAKAVAQAVERYGGNPGRSGHKLSMRVSEKIFTVRQQAAEMFGAQTENVAFTANCTHALNMAIKGVMQYGGHMIISDHEHNAVARPVYALSKTRGVKYSIARTGETDSETVENFRRLITPETKCICCTVASNVTGRLMPYRELAALCKAHGICFIADGAQACGVIDVKLSQGINILCTAGHKSLYGPSGTGLLISDGSFAITPLMEGGTGSTSLELDQPDFMPDCLESGTVNTCGVIALGEGIRFVSDIGTDRIFTHETTLCKRFIEGIKGFDNVVIYRDTGRYLPIVSFNIKGLTSNETASLLSDAGYALRGGLHCSGLAHKAIGTAPEGTVRFSPSVFSTKAEVDGLIKSVKKIAAAAKTRSV